MQSWTTEVVRGNVDDHRSERLVAFWTGHGALDEPAAREQAPRVAAIALDGDEIAGTCSVADEQVVAIGGRRLWVFRSFVAPGADDAWRELLRATYEALASEFDPDGDGPIGLCVPVSPDRAARWADPVWSDPRTVYARTLPDGGHLRVAYFPKADIAPRVSPRLPLSTWDFDSGPPVLRFSQQDRVGPQDVIDFWLREGAVEPTEAERRAGEIELVVLGEDDKILGVGTAYLAHNRQLGTLMWHARGFVDPSERRSMVGGRIGVWIVKVLAERFQSGTDTRAPGIMFEVENPDLKKFFPEAVWQPDDHTFIDQDDLGRHVRVHWFAGARL